MRHRQTKEAATDMFDLQPPRHIPTLPQKLTWLERPLRSVDREVVGRNNSERDIAPKSNVIGVADPVAQRGRQNRRLRQREQSEALPGFIPPACNQRKQREQGRSIRFRRELVGPAKPKR